MTFVTLEYILFNSLSTSNLKGAFVSRLEILLPGIAFLENNNGNFIPGYFIKIVFG